MGGFSRRRFLDTIGGLGTLLPFALQTTDAAPAAPMLTRPIPATGEALPAVGLGTYEVFDVPNTQDALVPLVEVIAELAAHGRCVVDSSPVYGRAETTTGLVADRARVADRLFYATKIWTRGKAEGLAEMSRSFQRLRIDTLDLLQIHNLLDWRTQVASLEAWKAAGRIRYLGITHYHAGAYRELAEVMNTRRFTFVQLNYSLLEREAEQRLLPLAADLGMAVLVNRPFAQGVLFQRVKGLPLPGWATEFGCASWAQFFLKYILSHPAVTCVIPATAKLAHLKDNLAAARGALPDPAQRERMAALIATL